jgi:CheY-like chemotaxis protein/curved DNA-binding protein CbpA
LNTPAAAPPHILVVDDDRPMQRLLADALGQQGFTVTVEQDGEWALKTFASKDFAAVVLDVHLPTLNGFDVARKLRELPRGKRVPLVFISGVYKTVQHQRDGRDRHGAVAYLEKPFKLATLYKALHAALGGAYPRPIAQAPASDETAGDELADAQAREEQSQVESTSGAAGFANAMRGDFRNQSFPELLAELHRFKSTGALLLRRDNVKKIVYFRNGEPQLVKSNLLSECLGRVMVRERMISEAACEESLRRMKASKRQQGTVLIEMGCISPANLSYALNLQLRAKLFEIFSWTQGEYQFNKRVDLPSEPVGLEMSTALLIYEGVRRAFDETRLRTVLGDVDGQFVHPAQEPVYSLQDVGLGEEERWVLEAADGRKTVAQLRALDLLPPLDTDRLLYAMKCAQVIDLRPTPVVAKPVVPPTFQASTSTAVPPPLPGGGKARQAVPWSGADTSPEMPEIPLDLLDAAPTDPSMGPLSLGHSGVRPPPLPRSAVAQNTLEDDLATLDEREVREKLTTRLATLRKQDFFELLGVERDADTDAIEQAYRRKAHEFDPGRLPSDVAGDIRQLVSQISDLIGYAHHTLADDTDRRRYLEDLEAGLKPKMGEEMGSLLAAEGKYQKGEELMRLGSYVAAHQLFKEAVALYAQEGDFHAYLGWSRFRMEPDSMEATLEAIESLAKAISLNPRSEKGYLFTGYIYKATGRPELAERQFEKAIQANPSCEEALAELSLLGGGKR